MSNDTDLGTMLGWGLRRYAWLVALFVLALGVVVPIALQRAPERFEARAQVGPVKVLKVPSLDVLPRMATDVFRSIPEDPAVKSAAGLPGPEALGPDQLELVAAQDNIIFTIIARDESPERAAVTANAAASSFVRELNVYSQPVGSFSINRLATVPSEPMPTLAGPLAWVIGIAAGLLAGLGTVLALLMLRRPVVEATTVSQATGVTALGRITLGRGGDPSAGMNQVCHRILSQPTRMVLMVGPPDTRWARQDLTEELASWLGRVRRVSAVGSREPLDDYGSASLLLPEDPDVLIVLDDASPVEVATRPENSLTLLVVREGISRATLQEQAQQCLDGGNGAAVLVRRRSRLATLRSRLRGPATRRGRRRPRSSRLAGSWHLRSRHGTSHSREADPAPTGGDRPE